MVYVQYERSLETIIGHDQIIWLGGLNYRIMLSHQLVKALVEMRNSRERLECKETPCGCPIEPLPLYVKYLFPMRAASPIIFARGLEKSGTALTLTFSRLRGVHSPSRHPHHAAADPARGMTPSSPTWPRATQPQRPNPHVVADLASRLAATMPSWKLEG